MCGPTRLTRCIAIRMLPLLLLLLPLVRSTTTMALDRVLATLLLAYLPEPLYRLRLKLAVYVVHHQHYHSIERLAHYLRHDTLIDMCVCVCARVCVCVCVCVCVRVFVSVVRLRGVHRRQSTPSLWIGREHVRLVRTSVSVSSLDCSIPTNASLFMTTFVNQLTNSKVYHFIRTVYMGGCSYNNVHLLTTTQHSPGGSEGHRQRMG
jgi:hypothetical protein